MTLTKNVRGYYEIRLTRPDGRHRRMSLKTRNKEEAMEKIRDSKLNEMELAAKMGVLSHGVFSVLTSGNNCLTVSQALRPWEDHMRYLRNSPASIHDSLIWVKAWMKWGHYEKMPVAEMELQHLDGWINSGSDSKVGTRRVMLSALKSFCVFCRDKGWIQGNPAELVKIDLSILLHEQKETLKRPIFQEDEVQQLLDITAPGGAHESTFWHAAVLIGRHTGLRLGDICSLEWDCFNYELGTISVWTQKRDRRVSLFLEPKVMEVIQALPMEHEQFVFPMERATVRDPMVRARLSSYFWKILRSCGIFGRSFHCLRATYITDCKERGIPMEHIRESVGHWSRQTTEGYVRPRDAA